MIMAHSFSYFSVPTAWQDGDLESNEHGGNPSRDSLDYHLAALSLHFPASPFQEQHQLDHGAHAILPQFDVVNEFDLEFQEDVSVNDFDVEPAMDNNVDISVDDFDVEPAMDNNVDISVDDFDVEPAMDNNVDISVDDFDFEPAMDNHVIANSGASCSNMNPFKTQTCSVGLQSHPSLEEQPKLSGSEFTNKARMRWTQPLHDLFVQAVTELGGPDRATPKSILILMGVEGITMCQVKSHLQKYRLARLEAQFQEAQRSSCSEGKKKTPTEKYNNGHNKLLMEETETLHTQLELQKKLHYQLTVLRELQIQTEENGRRLQEFIENQREAFMMITKSISTSRVASSVNLEHNTVDDVIYVDSDSDTEDSFPSHKRTRFA